MKEGKDSLLGVHNVIFYTTLKSEPFELNRH